MSVPNSQPPSSASLESLSRVRGLSQPSFGSGLVPPLLSPAGPRRMLSLPGGPPVQLPLHAQRPHPFFVPPLQSALPHHLHPPDAGKPQFTPPSRSQHELQLKHTSNPLAPRADVLVSLPSSVASTPSSVSSAAVSLFSGGRAAASPASVGERRRIPLQAAWLLEERTPLSELALAAALATPPRPIASSSASSSSSSSSSSSAAIAPKTNPQPQHQPQSQSQLRPSHSRAPPQQSRSKSLLEQRPQPPKQGSLGGVNRSFHTPAKSAPATPAAAAEVHVFSALKHLRHKRTLAGNNGSSTPTALLELHTPSRLRETRAQLPNGASVVVGPGRGLDFRVAALVQASAAGSGAPAAAANQGSQPGRANQPVARATPGTILGPRPFHLDFSTAAKVLIAAASGAPYDDSDDSDVRMHDDAEDGDDDGYYSGDSGGLNDDDFVGNEDGNWASGTQLDGYDSEATADDEADDPISQSQPVVSSSRTNSQGSRAQAGARSSGSRGRSGKASSTLRRASSAPSAVSTPSSRRAATASKPNSAAKSRKPAAALATPTSKSRKRKSPASSPDSHSTSPSSADHAEDSASADGSGREKRARVSAQTSASDDDESSPGNAGRRGHRRPPGVAGASGGRHSCPHCDYTSGSSSGLKLHMLVHTGQKPHACPICGRRFRQKHHMIGHTRIHSGEKPFVCHLCGRAHKDCSGLRSHFKRHHPGAPCPSASDYRDGVLILPLASAEAGYSADSSSAAADAESSHGSANQD